MKVVRNSRGMSISQRECAIDLLTENYKKIIKKDLLTKTGMLGCKSVPTPVEPEYETTKITDETPTNEIRF